MNYSDKLKLSIELGQALSKLYMEIYNFILETKAQKNPTPKEQVLSNAKFRIYMAKRDEYLFLLRKTCPRKFRKQFDENHKLLKDVLIEEFKN